jgi:putative ABC transport system ATP-binding protein
VFLIEDLSVELAPGELVALTGPSGCGKTTLLNVVAGLRDAVGGEVRLLGRTPAEIGWPLWRRQVSLVPQTPVLFEGTVAANLARPFAYRTSRGSFPRERAVELLERLGLGDGRMEQEARSLSLGQQQRIGLLRSLLVEPAVLLLDEPTSALDESAAQAVEDLLREEARERGLAALVVTHLAGQVESLCARRIDLSPFLVTEPG